ncbi:nSTAND1 domain-containing NTPase [Pseudomonas laurentiana]
MSVPFSDVQLPEARRDATPYKQLDFYGEEDADRFAGRERDIAQVVARACTQRSLVIYGRSGLGKTSLLKAGVMPLLRERGFLPIYVRTLEEPLQDLTRAVHAHCDKTMPLDAPLDTLVRAAGEVSPLIIVLDQFEEFFIRFRTRAEERSTFVRALCAVINDPTLDLRVLFSLREEYLAALDGFLEMLPDLFTYAYRLGPLSAFGCREAIVRPLISDGYSYDEQLVTRLVDELAKFDFDSARLQVTCTELFEAAVDAHERKRILTETDFNHLTQDLQAPAAVGDVSATQVALLPGEHPSRAVLEGIFRRYLTRKIAPIARKWPLIARLILRVMITREETKYAITLEELRRFLFCSNEDLDQVLEQLVERKIVRPPEYDADSPCRVNRPQWYELIHECLVPEILRWLEQDEEFKSFVLVEQLVETNADFYSKGSLVLLDSKSLAGVRAQRTRLHLTHTQMEYLLLSAVQCEEIEDVKLWAAAVGWPKARDFVSSLLTPESATVGAAQAAAIFTDAPGDLVQNCFRLAADKSLDKNLRHAAAQSYTQLVPDTIMRELPTSLHQWHDEHIGDLVAELHDSGRTLKLWGWSWRRRARKLSQERKLQAYSREVGDPSSAGMFGVAAGLMWAFTCGVLLATFLYTFSTDAASYYELFAIATVIAVACSPILGWRLCVVAAATAAAYGEGKWYRTIQHSGMSLLVLWVALLAMTVLIVDTLNVQKPWDILAVVAPLNIVPAWIMRFLLAVTAEFVIPLVWPAKSSAVILSVAATCAIVLWVLIPGVILLPLLDRVTSSSGVDLFASATPQTILYSAMFVLALMSLLTLVHTAVLARRPHLNVESSLLPSWTWRSIVLSLAFLCVTTTLGVYLTPRTLVLDLKPNGLARLPIQFHRWPERLNLQINSENTPTLMKLTDSQNTSLNIKQFRLNSLNSRWNFSSTDTLNLFKMNEQSYLYASSKTTKLSISNYNESRPRDVNSLAIEEAHLDGCDVKRLVEGQAIQLCPLQRTANGWSATLSGRIQGANGTRPRYRLVFPTSWSFERGTYQATTVIEGVKVDVKGVLTLDGLFVVSPFSWFDDNLLSSPLILPPKYDNGDFVWQVTITITPLEGLRSPTDENLPAFIVVSVQQETEKPFAARRD